MSWAGRMLQEGGQDPLCREAAGEEGWEGEAEGGLQPGGEGRPGVWRRAVLLPAGRVRSDPDPAPQSDSAR